MFRSEGYSFQALYCREVLPYKQSIGSIGRQNCAELAVCRIKGFRVLVAHSHPEIPNVPAKVALIYRYNYVQLMFYYMQW